MIDLVSRYFMNINDCSLITAFKSYMFVGATRITEGGGGPIL